MLKNPKVKMRNKIYMWFNSTPIELHVWGIGSLLVLLGLAYTIVFG